QSPVYEPHRDEFLYLAEGRHMAWGFMEVPPLLSVFAWLTNMFGGEMFLMKLWSSLFGSLTYIIVGKIILSLGGRSFALFLAFLPRRNCWLTHFSSKHFMAISKSFACCISYEGIAANTIAIYRYAEFSY